MYTYTNLFCYSRPAPISCLTHTWKLGKRPSSLAGHLPWASEDRISVSLSAVPHCWSLRHLLAILVWSPLHNKTPDPQHLEQQRVYLACTSRSQPIIEGSQGKNSRHEQKQSPSRSTTCWLPASDSGFLQNRVQFHSMCDSGQIRQTHQMTI